MSDNPSPKLTEIDESVKFEEEKRCWKGPNKNKNKNYGKH